MLKVKAPDPVLTNRATVPVVMLVVDSVTVRFAVSVPVWKTTEFVTDGTKFAAASVAIVTMAGIESLPARAWRRVNLGRNRMAFVYATNKVNGSRIMLSAEHIIAVHDEGEGSAVTMAVTGNSGAYLVYLSDSVDDLISRVDTALAYRRGR